MQKQQALSERVATQPVTPPAPPQTPQKPARQAWRVKPTDITLRKEGEVKGEASKTEKETIARQGQASELIKPATWAKAAYPRRTIFRSMPLAGRLVDAVNSDIPGQMRIALTIPLFDKFEGNYEILPKDTLIIANQEGRPDHGSTRLNLKLEQIELPTGEVISLKATVGDSQGANGLKADVNGHYGKLFLAAGISAILNIGVQSVAGTPGAGQFYQNPAQAAAGDMGRSVQRDAQSVVDRELRIPPTLTLPSGTVCTINLQENITFSRRPVVVR
jgi:type IV secretory pathway VirB10-like protein